jgi:rubrerythrin
MSYDFNADEIFEIAEQIEKNGAAFYRQAADSVEQPEVKAFLTDLAKMEDDHQLVFANLRSELGAAEKKTTVFDPQDEAAQYLKALADTRVFFEKEIDTSTLEAILKDAIGAEKDSIVFYLGMKSLVPDALGKGRLDDIINEEMSHINLLSRKLLDVKIDRVYG